MYFQYGEKEIVYLTKKDKRLGQAIERIGLLRRRVNPDLFAELVACIVSQQISDKAAETVGARLLALAGELNPQRIAALQQEAIQQCGMSMRKAGYIKGVADAVLSGKLDIDAIAGKTDEQVIKNLSALNGIGVWTAEMLLIFTLQRPDIVSWGDLAIRRGMMRLYGHKELTKVQFDRYKKRYSPYGTVASLYLWKLSAE